MKRSAVGIVERKPETREDIEDLTDELAHTFVATHDPEIKKPDLLLLGLRLSLREYVIARPGSFYPAGFSYFKAVFSNQANLNPA